LNDGHGHGNAKDDFVNNSNKQQFRKLNPLTYRFEDLNEHKRNKIAIMNPDILRKKILEKLKAYNFLPRDVDPRTEMIEKDDVKSVKNIETKDEAVEQEEKRVMKLITEIEIKAHEIVKS
jgi:hypothetical protein